MYKSCDLELKMSDKTIHGFIIRDNLNEIKQLIEQGCNINTLDNIGNTPLMTAANKGNIEIFTYLLQNNPDLTIKNKYNRTVVHYTLKLPQQLPMLKMLINKGVDLNSPEILPLIIAVRNKNFEAIKLLIESGAEIDYQDNGGWTPLHAASHRGQLDITKYLIDLGAAINKPTFNGKTALMFATKMGHLDIVQYLIKSGADLNQTDNNGCSALHIAAYSKMDHIVQCLTEAGADLSLVNTFGETALSSQ